MTTLLPCPFCGSTNIDPEGWASTERAGPACDDCAGTADTIDLWNSRPGAGTQCRSRQSSDPDGAADIGRTAGSNPATGATSLKIVPDAVQFRTLADIIESDPEWFQYEIGDEVLVRALRLASEYASRTAANFPAGATGVGLVGDIQREQNPT